MPHIDPMVRFWIGVVVTVAITISQGTISLTHAIPDSMIPATTAWFGIIAIIGSSILTAMNGGATTIASRIASAAALPGVKRMDVTPEVAAAVFPETHNEVNLVTVAK